LHDGLNAFELYCNAMFYCNAAVCSGEDFCYRRIVVHDGDGTYGQNILDTYPKI